MTVSATPAAESRAERMSRRQAAFRADFRAKIGRLYSGWAHVALIYAIGLAAIWYFARQVDSPAWYEWLAVPVAFLAANIFEWWIHKYIMHRPVKGFMGIYKRHTLAHHQFFTEHEISVDNSRDFRIVFFPPYALVTFIAMTLVPAALLMRAGLPNAGWLLLITNTAIYLNYELFHYCCHVKDDRIVRHIPLVNTIRRHHAAHHNTSIMMERNFNLTYPIADWLFGTSDLRRGLLGHLFNGYDTTHLRPDLRRAKHTKDDPRAGEPRVARTAAAE
ncbi:sterol desaturase family protein [Caldovatus aquaticus]|uniref:Sterol desaturase family protein n=1 Tax=Caldovatus aquaticus TaxID=2865671 RepID=A0ABS7F243_9PROT|nr:sterol desaturase family protein [Caldovatus aquaticus]MBW8269639.1 sterol desaturase family protein [Caldovatus aquaticus]